MSAIDFVIFAPRILAMRDTFRPPWFHRNLASEFMGLVTGAYDAKAEGFLPGGASLHNSMSGHGPDAETFEKASAADLSKPDVIENTMAFMFETRQVLRPTAHALETAERQREYWRCWQGLQKHFNPDAAMTSYYPIDETHASELQSWVASANDPTSDFPIQNLPFGRFRRAGAREWRIGVAIGDQVLDLQAAGLVDHGDMNRSDGSAARCSAVRCARRLSEGLSSGSAQARGLARGARAAERRRTGRALPHRRLHRLLREHPSRDHGRQAVPS